MCGTAEVRLADNVSCLVPRYETKVGNHDQ